MRLAPRSANDRHRDQAIDALQLRPGQRVVDVGCGRGAAFHSLRAGVGDAGAVVGMDIDADALNRATSLTVENGWSNVRMFQVPAATCDWGEPADAALFAFLGELTLDPASVLNVLRQLRPRARVAWVDRLPDTQNGRPWRLLTAYLSDFAVEPLGSRGYFVAHGHVQSHEARPDRDR